MSDEPTERDVVAAEALMKAADAWMQGAWADTPRHSEPTQDRIGAANYFGYWLRARAAALRGDA